VRGTGIHGHCCLVRGTIGVSGIILSSTLACFYLKKRDRLIMRSESRALVNVRLAVDITLLDKARLLLGLHSVLV
jgi:hypothetical protein